MTSTTIDLSKIDLTTPTSVETSYINELPNGELQVAPEKSNVAIAPCNSILNFLNIINSTFTLLQLAPVSAPKLPKKFTWKDGKTDISPVFTQYNCGCCWVISTTQAINDSIVCNPNIQFIKNPNINPTNLLACYNSEDNNGMCKGGNPLDALEFVEKNGIQNKNMNYDWCKDNKGCKGPSPPILAPSMLELNGLVPKCPKKQSIQFYVGGMKHFIVNNNEKKIKKRVSNLINHVKEHILNNGPVIGGYIVYTNFLKGFFLKRGNSHAIYFDKYDYEKDTYKKDGFEIFGFHSVSIIGWGVDKNVDGIFIGKKKGTKHTVPYWIVRNSWGEKWGIDGYFRMAMFPFNEHSQFEVSSSVSGYDKESLTYGGILTFKTSLTPIIEKENYIPEPKMTKTQWILISIFLFFIVLKILISI